MQVTKGLFRVIILEPKQKSGANLMVAKVIDASDAHKSFWIFVSNFAEAEQIKSNKIIISMERKRSIKLTKSQRGWGA